VVFGLVVKTVGLPLAET